MTDAGHSLAHLPQPTHFFQSTTAWIPLQTVIAPKGQTLAQHPHATHRFLSTSAVLRFLFTVSMFFSLFFCPGTAQDTLFLHRISYFFESSVTQSRYA